MNPTRTDTRGLLARTRVAGLRDTRPRRMGRRGFTLIELMIGTAIGLFIIAAAFTFIVHQNRLLEFTNREIDRDRSGRIALDLLAQDLRHAGVGVGYEADGTFNGLMLGEFTVAGGAAFDADDHPITLSTRHDEVETPYDFGTDDIGIRFANGSFRTITQFGAGAGQVCRGGEYEAGDVVLFTSESGFDARTARLLSIEPADACIIGECVGGCSTFTWAEDASFFGSPTSASANYEGGEMAGAYHQVIWFVDAGELRRAEVTSSSPCSARDSTCGGTAAFNVETLQMQVWQWDPDTAAWEDRTALQSLTDRRRIRVDVEMVVRMQGGKSYARNAIELQLEPNTCLPACGAQDEIERRAFRVSVEIRNSGRLQIGGET